MNNTAFVSWPKQLWFRFSTLWLTKALGTMTFMVLFFGLYFAVLQAPITTPMVMPLTWVDHQIAFIPSAYGIYISLWVYVSLPAALQLNFRNLLHFGSWMAAMCAIGLCIFWLAPTKIPEFDIDWLQHPELLQIKGLDATGNACPSLHVATAVFSMFWLDAILRNSEAPQILRKLNVLHCIAIGWSTMAIRQHVALDVLAGTLLGVGFASMSLWLKRSTIKI